MPEPFASSRGAALPSGKRVLVVEDEVIVAMQLEDLLRELGCDVIGPACRLDEALAMAEGDGIDLALLDVNLNGRSVCPVAQRLSDRGVPVVYATGYGQAGCADLPPGGVLQKPYLPSDLVRAMRGAFGVA